MGGDGSLQRLPLGHKCTIVTDHHPLKYIDMGNLGCTEKKWVQLLVLLYDEVLIKFHDEAGHFVPKRTLKFIWPRFYWHGMNDSVKQWCTSCK